MENVDTCLKEEHQSGQTSDTSPRIGNLLKRVESEAGWCRQNANKRGGEGSLRAVSELSSREKEQAI